MRWRARRVDCPQCGASAPADARWCGTCGAALVVAPEADVDDVPPSDGRVGRLLAAGLVVAVLGGLLVAQSASGPPVVPAGYASRGDGARTGVVSTVPVPAPTRVVWREPVDLPPLLTPGTDVLGTTTTAAARELVVVHDPSPDGQRLTSHDATTGELVATTMLPLGGQPFSTSLRDGLLAHRDLASVTLVDMTTGERRWRVEERLREDSVLTPAGVVGVPAAAAGLALTLLDVEDGTRAWTTGRLGDARVQRLLWAAGVVVVVTDDRVLGVDPDDGTVLWRLDGEALPPPWSFPQPAPTTDGERVLFGNGDLVALLDPTDGSLTTTVVDGLVPGDVAVTELAEDLVLLSDGLRTVTALEVTDGGDASVRWSTSVPGGPIFSLEVTGDVVAVRGDGATSLLDLANGTPVARVGPAGGTPRLVVTSDGAVAQVTATGDLQAVGADGVRWQVPTVAVHLPDLATDEGAVAVTTPDGVQVHDVDDGDRRWAHAAFEPSLVVADALTPPALLAGRVLVAPPLTQPPDRGGLLALFADTGIVDWARTDDRVVPRGTPVVDRDLVLVPVGSQVLGYDRISGRRALVVETTIARTDLAAAGGWIAATDARRDAGDLWVGRRASRDLVFRAPIRTCAPPVLLEDLVVVVNHLDDVVARELETGEQPWGEKAGGSACRPLTIAGDVLVALVHDRELLAVRLDDGETAWRIDLPATAAGAPVAAGDQVLVPTLDGEVVAYDVRGTTAPEGPAWRVEVGGVPAGAVAVDGGTVLVVTRAGELVALR